MDITDIIDEKLTQRELSAINTKNLLLETSMYLFKERGYDNVSVDDITKLSNVSKGTFYNHFASKECVFVEEFKKIDAYYDLKLSQIKKDISSKEKILILINAMTDYCSNICGIEFMRIVYSSQISNTKTFLILNNKNRKLYTHLEDIVAMGIKTGEFNSNMDIKKTVEWIVRAARALIYDWCLYNGEFNLEKEGANYFEYIVSLLK